MSDRVQMLEATLDLMDEGVAILDSQSKVLFWNKAAAALTGRSAAEMVCHSCPDDLYRIDEEHRSLTGAVRGDRRSGIRATKAIEDPNCLPCRESQNQSEKSDSSDASLLRPTLVSMSHKLGHRVPGMLRKAILRDANDEPTGGEALLFYPVEDFDALPHGECSDCGDVERSQAEMEDRLEAAHHQWTCNRVPFGLLWVTVDQAQSMRRTHGREACESMMKTVEQTLIRQMKPAEIIGRWGNNEFLVLAHERAGKLLVEHAAHLAGLARTADFRWWGDRAALTLSIGASQAHSGDTLQSLLNRARQAMQTSGYAGGNQVTEAREN